MKITKYHHKNSQIHCIPREERHTVEVTCLCDPKLTMLNGHIMVEHKTDKGFKGSWTADVRNYGVKLLDNKGVPV